MVYLFLADGFEEVEALTPLDMLRRADVPVCTVGVGDMTIIRGAHGICVQVDQKESSINLSDMDGVILPGGMPGTLNLEQSPVVQNAIRHAITHNLPIAAICAAPSILGHAEMLKGRSAVCFPGFEHALIGANLVTASVVTDGNITTAKGAGVALDFALELVKVFCSQDKAEEIRSAIQCR